MKNPKLIVLPLVSFALIGCSSSVNPQPVIEDKVELFSVSSHENLLSDHDYYNDDNYKERGYNLSFNGLRGENDGLQLIMHATKNVSNFDFVINDDIKDAEGNQFSKENFGIFAEWYQYVRSSNEPIKYAPRGYYPDGLIPLKKYQEKQKDFFDKNRNQGIYVNVKIPEDATPGLYNGTGTLTVDGKTYSIPISINVHVGVLPKASHFKSCFLVWYDQITIGEKDNVTEKTEDYYYETAIEHRITPDRMPSKYESSAKIFAETMATLVAPDDRITQYRFPVNFGSYSKEKVDEYMNALVKKEKEINYKYDLFEKLFFYIDDEPGPNDYERVREHDNVIYQLKKKYIEEIDAGHDDIKNSILKMKNVVTTPFNKGLIAKDGETAEKDVGGVQTWCPQFTHFHDEKERLLYKERQQSKDRSCGENVWWYGCYDPHSPYPSYHLDATAAYARTIPYMQYAYGIDGEIYWGLNYYSKRDKNVTTTRDIWYDPISWEGCAGDGCLYYPGYNFNCEKPISTLRLENILAGNEEFERLYMLGKKVEEFNKKYSTTHDLNTLLAKQYATLFSGVQPARDPKIVLSVGEKLLEAIDKFTVSLEDGMEYLISLGA